MNLAEYFAPRPELNHIGVGQWFYDKHNLRVGVLTWMPYLGINKIVLVIFSRVNHAELYNSGMEVNNTHQLNERECKELARTTNAKLEDLEIISLEEAINYLRKAYSPTGSLNEFPNF